MPLGVNGDSYQRREHDAGAYVEIPSNGSASGGSGNKKKWIIAAAALLAILGTVYCVTLLRQTNPEKAVNKSLADNANVHVLDNGKLRLFDEFSKFLADIGRLLPELKRERGMMQ